MRIKVSETANGDIVISHGVNEVNSTYLKQLPLFMELAKQGLIVSMGEWDETKAEVSLNLLRLGANHIVFCCGYSNAVFDNCNASGRHGGDKQSVLERDVSKKMNQHSDHAEKIEVVICDCGSYLKFFLKLWKEEAESKI